MEKRLYLVRHGQTLFNRRGLIQGWCDSPLTEEGISQAKRVRDEFQRLGIVFDHAYSSASERACDTLEILTDMPYTRLKALKEWHFGSLEGQSADLGFKRPFGPLLKQYFGGESEEEFHGRLFAALHEIMEKEDHESVLVVSHGCACEEFALAGCRPGPVRCPIPMPNCCVLIFGYEEGEFVLKEWSVPAF